MPSFIKNSIINYCSSHSLSLPSVSLREIWLRWPLVEAGRRTIWVHRWGGHEGSSKTRMICWVITAAEAQDWEGHNSELLNPSKENPSASALYLNRTVSPLLLHHSWDKRVCLKAPAVLTVLLPKQTNSLSEFPVTLLVCSWYFSLIQLFCPCHSVYRSHLKLSIYSINTIKHYFIP